MTRDRRRDDGTKVVEVIPNGSQKDLEVIFLRFQPREH